DPGRRADRLRLARRGGVLDPGPGPGVPAGRAARQPPDHAGGRAAMSAVMSPGAPAGTLTARGALHLQPAKWSIRVRKHNDGGHESSDKTGGAGQVAKPESDHGEFAGMRGDARHGVRVDGRTDSNPGKGTMALFIQQLINGLTLGAIYGLIAIGYTMVYGIIGMINFAHGDIYMIGAFNALIAFLVLGVLGVTWVPLALVLVLVIAVVITASY